MDVQTCLRIEREAGVNLLGAATDETIALTEYAKLDDNATFWSVLNAALPSTPEIRGLDEFIAAKKAFMRAITSTFIRQQQNSVASLVDSAIAVSESYLEARSDALADATSGDSA